MSIWSRESLFFPFMWYFTLSILPCWQQIFPFYFASWNLSVENIVTICNLPVNNLTAGLPVSEKAQLLPAMKISFMGLPGGKWLPGKDTFQLEFGQHKALSVSKSHIKAVWEKITHQVCRDAVKITRKCRYFPPATGPVWELAARDWQKSGMIQGEHPWGCFEGAGSRETEAGLSLGNGTSEQNIVVQTSAPNRAPGIPASLALGDPSWPSWGRG